METVWNYSANKDLKKLRKDPNILLPGDIVIVPDLRVKEVSESTNQVHKFQVKNSPAKLKLRILKGAEPRAGEPFVLVIDGVEKDRGTISSDGNIQISILPNAKKGKLTVGEGENQEIYELNVGHLDPIDSISGVKSRLNNIGFDCGKLNNEMDEETKTAVKNFQSFINHPDPSGELDDRTKKALAKLHDQSNS